MLESLPELFDALLTPLLAVVGATLVGGGLFAELQSYSSLGGGGDLVWGVWLAVMGAAAVAMGVKVFTDALAGRLA
ncbi:hypothetical protein [Halobacterium jilantaiense]|uniref:DUF8151 domain-containing protein n=1 Tax=Halobacterium jilantaiense TaxID=355548 RepID=A0A1I0PXK0_9EURY|nr:hypothetical protein [Halobacterium jilantaiense]SEW19201.1 hypothetical protein SAMN04487945_2064 [Halobacterium jilantaiense]